MRALLFTAVLVAGQLATLPASANVTYIGKQEAGEYLVRDRLMGAKVKDDSGAIIGDIEDLIVTDRNEITGVIMGVGGFLGIGEKRVAVPLTSLNIHMEDAGLNVSLPGVTKAGLEAAPAYERAKPQKGWLQRAAEKGAELRDKSAVTAKDAYEDAKEAAKKLGESSEPAGDAGTTDTPAPATTPEPTPAPATP